MTTRLGDIRCSQVADEDIPLLAAVTRLTEATVRRRIGRAHGNVLVMNAFDDEWPFDAEALRGISVATARRAALVDELSGETGLGTRAVKNRLEKEHGKTLLGNAFPELAEADVDEEEDEQDDEAEGEDDVEEGAPAGWERYRERSAKFSADELVRGIKVVSVRRAALFIEWFAAELGVEKRWVKQKLSAAHGRGTLRTRFADHFRGAVSTPGAQVLAAMTVAAARRSPSLVRLIADVGRSDPRDVMSVLVGAAGNALVGTVLPSLERRSAPSSNPPKPSNKTQILDGRYELGRLLGEGGFGRVFEARRVDPPHERVVVKLAIPDKPESLRNEIGNAYGLTHQNICSYKDRGRDPTLGTYLVLQHGGLSLERVIERDGALDVVRAVDVVRQAAAGLDYAHKNGVIHQDVKPGNILVGEAEEEWEVRVTDFGISLKGTSAKNTVGKHTVVATHPIGYTPAYAAPEQRDGAKARKASDQYSLALVFCSMLEGRVFTRPYEPRRFGRLAARQNEALLKALSSDPDDRFESCSGFARALSS